MGFGGSSLSYSAAPYPSSSSSSSTLSPLAPPFTVDRPGPRPTLAPDAPYVSTWPLPSHSSDNMPHLPLPSPSPPLTSPPGPAYVANTAADAPPYIGHGGPPEISGLARASSGETGFWRNTDLAQVEPYYPQFGAVAVTSGDDSLAFYGDRRQGCLGGSGYLGRRVSPANLPFDVGTQAEGAGRGSSWVEGEDLGLASGYGVVLQQDASAPDFVASAPDFVASEDLQGGWHGKFTELPSGKDHFKYEHFNWLGVGKNAGVSSNLSGASASSPNAPVGMCYPHLSDMLTFMEGSKTFDSNSSDDRYMCESNTDRTDPRTVYPAMTYFPAKTYASSSSMNTSMEKSSLKINNHVQHVDTYKNGVLHKDRVSIRPKEPGTGLNFECKEDYAEMNISGNMRRSDNTIVDSSVVKITLPPSMESNKQTFQGYSFEKVSKSGIEKSKIPGSIRCDCKQSSPEMLDENLAVDSPCWKGALSARLSASGTFDTTFVNSAPSDQKFDYSHKRGPDDQKVENAEVTLHSSALRKDGTIVIPSKDHGENLEQKNKNGVEAPNEKKDSMPATNISVSEIANRCPDAGPLQGVSSSFCPLAKEQLPFAFKAVADVCDEKVKPLVISGPSFEDPAIGIDVQLLVKTIHHLSELLLSTCRLDANLLKEHEKELLQSAANNLDMCISRKFESRRMRPELLFGSGNYPYSESSAFSEGAPVGKFQATGSKATEGSMDQGNNRRFCPGQENMHSICSNVGSSKLCSFSTTCDGNFKKVRLSEKVINENIYEQGESAHAIFCENLWFEVEDTVHSLKHKLQLLKSNIVVDNKKQQLTKDAEWETSNILKLSSQNSASNPIGRSIIPWNSVDDLPNNLSTLEKHENTGDFLKPQQTISSIIDNKVDNADARIMARYKVLKGRIDRLNFVDVEEQHGQLNPLNVVSKSGTHENICSPHLSDGKLNSEMEFQPADDAMPAGWGYQPLFHSGGMGGKVIGSSVRHHDVEYSEDQCPNSHFSEHRMAEGYFLQCASGLGNQSCVPDSRSVRQFAAGARGGSSDWEHVLKEELTW